MPSSESSSTEKKLPAAADVHEVADEFLSGLPLLKIKASEVKNDDDTMEWDDELCKTPTRPENQIRVLSCPPAPRKKRSSPSAMPFKWRQLRRVCYVILLQETMDSIFQPRDEQSSARRGGNKRRRIS